jgi:Zn-dependent protease with chaperone function
VKTTFLLIVISFLALLTVFAIMFAVAVLSRGHTGGETFSVFLAVIAPLVALIGTSISYRRMKRLAQRPIP